MGRTSNIIASLALLAGTAAAQTISPDQVLVVYDSRTADSQAVATYYAGVRSGVHMLDLAAAGAAVSPAGNISYPNFITNIRNPIRAELIARKLDKQIRSIVLTKGLPHRIQDVGANPNIGDQPSQQGNQFNNAAATSASVDSELTLLWINLDTQTVSGVPLRNGAVFNPYYRGGRPVNLFSTANNRAAKTFGGTTGQFWQGATTGPVANRLTQGDITLVCRLDGRTVADVRAMIDRAADLRVNVDTAAMLLDESASNGIADAAPNAELDNLSDPTRFGDDYEQSRDRLTADKRYLPANILYNKDSGASQFYVGPRIVWNPTVLQTSLPVLLLATLGANHSGLPTRQGDNVSAGGLYPLSFNYARGAVFNTIESFNGRDFGGIGGWTGGNGIAQAQAADFIAAGGTFAIGNVWEPFTFSVARNNFIVQNFILGNLCWAEAAYTSLPVLSWQQIVLGDPLARVVRSCEDLTADGYVDVDDIHEWIRLPRDVNRDGAANAADRLIIENTARYFELLVIERGRR